MYPVYPSHRWPCALKKGSARRKFARSNSYLPGDYRAKRGGRINGYVTTRALRNFDPMYRDLEQRCGDDAAPGVFINDYPIQSAEDMVKALKR